MTLEIAFGFLINKKGKSFHDLDWYIRTAQRDYWFLCILTF